MDKKGGGTETVEYRDAERGYAVRLTLRVRAGDPPPPEAGEVGNLRCARCGDSVYQIAFARGPAPPNSSTTHYHEYPIAGVAWLEEERWPVAPPAKAKRGGAARDA